MHIIHNWEEASQSLPHCSITIGVFDGVHKGHQYLFSFMQQFHLPRCVFTFAELPWNTLHPDCPIFPLISLEEKMKFLQECGIEYLFLLHFTEKFSRITYADFMNMLLFHIPFSHLILGEDAQFGARQKGTKNEVLALSQKKGFSVHYIPRLQYQGIPISSTAIRQSLIKKNRNLAEKMLGRKLSDHFFLSRNL
ncbi:MAG: FAD synthetase family protein [Parachlamydiales bacterium]|nr:FAD synthetase family protein [Parachlamydiales bacterium]